MVHIRAESDVCVVVVCAGVRVVQAAGAKSAVFNGLFHLVRALFLRIGTYMPVWTVRKTSKIIRCYNSPMLGARLTKEKSRCKPLLGAVSKFGRVISKELEDSSLDIDLKKTCSESFVSTERIICQGEKKKNTCSEKRNEVIRSSDELLYRQIRWLAVGKVAPQWSIDEEEREPDRGDAAVANY